MSPETLPTRLLLAGGSLDSNYPLNSRAIFITKKPKWDWYEKGEITFPQYAAIPES